MPGAGHRSASAHPPAVDEAFAHATHLASRVEALLQPHAESLGADAASYRYHACRVAAFCRWLAAADTVDDADAERIAVAAAYHDLGIWTHGTFDYLQPSMDDCVTWMQANGRAAWIPEVTAMIADHHKLTASRSPHGLLVEPFRRADLVDLSRGVVAFGIPRGFRARVFSAWPSLGFRWRLVRFTLQRARRHPLSPLPMLRL